MHYDAINFNEFMVDLISGNAFGENLGFPDFIINIFIINIFHILNLLDVYL